MATITNIIRTRDKYDIIIGENSGKHAYYDISTDEKIGVSGKAVKSFNYSANALLTILVSERGSANAREFCDRLISLPTLTYERKNTLCKQVFPYGTYESTFVLILDNWKKFLEYAQTEETLSFSGYLEQKRLNDSLRFINNEKIEEYIRNNLYSDKTELITICEKYKTFRRTVAQYAKQARRAEDNRAKLAEKGLTAEVLLEDYGLTSANITHRTFNKITSLLEKYVKADKLIKYLNLSNYEIIDIDSAIRDLQSLRDTTESEKFALHQQTVNLEYENDSFKIFVPLSREDLAKYGNYFHNCLNGHEWECNLSTGYRYAVIVLDKKQNDKPVVCVDIKCTTLDIWQYLAKYNYSVTDQAQCDFREEYQRYLYSLREKMGS